MTLLRQWLFGKPSEQPLPEARLRAIEERLEALERGSKGIRLEWEEAFVRLERMIGRLTGALKRARTDDQEAGDTEVTPPVPGSMRRDQRTDGEILAAWRARKNAVLRR